MARVAVALSMAALAAPAAHAVGGSGGCGSWLDLPIGKAVTSGTPRDLEREIANWLELEERSLDLVDGLKVRVIAPARREWRKERTLVLLEGAKKMELPCLPGPLLQAAVIAGNLDVVRYLLGTPMGLSPQLPVNFVFFVCNADYPSAEALARRREALSMVLDTGKVSLRTLYRDRTILEFCEEPELVSLFVERGADVRFERGEGKFRMNLLERAISDAIRSQQGSRLVTRALGRARVYANYLTPSIEGRYLEERVRSSCNRVWKEPFNTDTCRELSTFIKAAPGTFGPG